MGKSVLSWLVSVLSWLTLDRILALVGIFAGIVAIYYEKSLHESFSVQQKSVSELVSSVTTRFVARFPTNLEYAHGIISAAKPRDQILILTDVVGYGYYSCPQKFQNYINAIITASQNEADIHVLIYDDAGAKRVLETQVTRSDYATMISTSRTAKYVADPCQTGAPAQQRYQAYLKFYNIAPPPNYESFMNSLINGQNAICRQLTATPHVILKSIDSSKVKNDGAPISQPIFFWMLQDKEMVFAYPNTGQVGKGASFKSSDQSLMAIFTSQFDSLWGDDNDKENIKSRKVDGYCYSSKF
jgi:hypothetical protein